MDQQGLDASWLYESMYFSCNIELDMPAPSADR